MTVPIRVLVVEDSLTVRKRLCDVLAADPSLKVVGEAEDGKRAIHLCETLRPDVVTMDIVMPKVDDIDGIGTPVVRLYDHDTDKFFSISVIAFHDCQAIAGR